jgi:pyruvate, orthophosphate dikinase
VRSEMAFGAMTGKFVSEITESEVKDSRRFGGKASGLAKMAAAGIPIPPAFVIGIDGFHHFRSNGQRIGHELLTEVLKSLQRLAELSGRPFAGGDRPLLISVRSGAPISMPGMMDTILNLGLRSKSAFRLARRLGNPDFALDTWLRFWRMFSDIVLGLDATALAESIKKAEVRAREKFSQQAFDELEDTILAHIERHGERASADPYIQLERTIEAVFRSWDSARAKAYRKHHSISDELGTAVTVQAMVFGNADERSGSGVAFTRNPNDGSRALYGEYLIGRQGEDLVSGTHTPIDLADPKALDKDLHDALIKHGNTLEALYSDAVDIEFTVESGRLYLLQVRPAKRTAIAAIKIAEDLVAEGLVTKNVALARISAAQVKKVSRPAFDEGELAAAQLLTQGLGSSPGQSHGAAILDADRAAERAATGEAVILLRPTTSPQDIQGMLSASGIVTAKGGALSHAAVVSRALDRPCIVGCEAIHIDLEQRTFSVGGKAYKEGDQISVDGTTGKIFAGAIKLQAGGGSIPSLRRILEWADVVSGAAVWAAARSSGEVDETQPTATPGIGIVGLTDLIIAHGAIERFVELTAAMGASKPAARTSVAIGAIVEQACAPILAAADKTQVHIRLPRVSSDRARRLIENWQELPPSFFLPLGSPPYLQAILSGISKAAQRGSHDSVTALIAGIADIGEFDAFRAEIERVGHLKAGATLQNVVALDAVRELSLSGGPLWIDVAEIVRTIHGFPIEVQQSLEALDMYAESGRLGSNPFRQPGNLLSSLLERALSGTGAQASSTIGIDGAGCSSELLGELYRIGFRRFAVPVARRDETRFLLGRLQEE